MQVRVRTNFAPSKSAGDRSGAAHAVIRRLFGVGAVVRVEDEGDAGAFFLQMFRKKRVNCNSKLQ